MDFEAKHRNRWNATIVILAVCALAVSLATRYGSPVDLSSHKVKRVESQTSTDSTRQRLTKNAANWIPPVLAFVVQQASVSYRRIAAVSVPPPNLLVAQKLYTRPPPSV
jgi:hypothetical protein